MKWFSAILALCSSLLLAGTCFAQQLTTASDTLIGPNGQPFSGSITVVNQATFTSADGFPVPANTTVNVTVGTNGQFSVSLVPNQGSTPPNTFCAAHYFLTGRLRMEETWVIPSSSTPVKLAAIRTSPISVPSFTILFAQISRSGAGPIRFRPGAAPSGLARLEEEAEGSSPVAI
jgi:hypothetical protein